MLCPSAGTSFPWDSRKCPDFSAGLPERFRAQGAPPVAHHSLCPRACTCPTGGQGNPARARRAGVRGQRSKLPQTENEVLAYEFTAGSFTKQGTHRKGGINRAKWMCGVLQGRAGKSAALEDRVRRRRDLSGHCGFLTRLSGPGLPVTVAWCGHTANIWMTNEDYEPQRTRLTDA